MRQNLNKITSEEEWATPLELYESLDKEFHFNLDPCASESNHKCETYFTKEDNGLLKDWGGTEYSVIHHMEEAYTNGSKRRMRNH